MTITGTFEPVSCQATVFTPDEDFASTKLLTQFYPAVANVFDGDHTVLPRFEGGLPPEIPRVIFEDKDGSWKCEIAPARVNVVWKRKGPTTEPIALEPFFTRATSVLKQYATLGMRVGRLAAVISRLLVCEDAGKALASHFCAEKWLTAPFNRPENFELHAHKRYLLRDAFDVNSWVRNKTGVTTVQEKTSVILVEQDLNTLAEHADKKAFSTDEIARFFEIVPREFDHILRLYYPEVTNG